MSFVGDTARFKAKTEQKLAAVRDGVDDETFRSVVEGSEITGAPGQPIGLSGKLHDSWNMERDVTETVIASDSPAALPVEENWSGGEFRNHGPHSVKLTVAGFDRIVQFVGEKVADS